MFYKAFLTASLPLILSVQGAPAPSAASFLARRITSNVPRSSSSSTNNTSGLQSSLTLDPSVIATGFENNGQNQPAAGQVASLTSSNNFINFCATASNVPLTNGQQIQGGSCNPAPMGLIPSVANMPSSKFVSPTNFGTVTANTDFTIQMAVNNLDTGFFTNADEDYFSAPQQLNSQGLIQGHTHFVIENLSSLTQVTPNDPTQFAFFKGVNTAAQNGIVNVTVTGGLPAGSYKLSSINSAMNHQPVLVAVAQHGSLDDAIYFSATESGATGGTSTSASSSIAVTSTVASTSVTTASSSAPSATATSSSNGANFGSCSTPQIEFGAGFNGRTETSFQAVDQNNIDVISGFICQRLISPCNANAAGQALCTQASAAADAASAQTGQQADAFNAVFGITTDFASVTPIAA
ncbi:hypothetical protein SERLA73DRAFT_162820 [Serpula lacrymans var. lacrymans S7.3]|uniref:Uncharacterized protein n=1 Tax=Serpula lacrymans var. lacrymans (strain S7.3) TaxID=936435 RepID=F8QAC3_SERL3|nr:hypothetical protein SERLA73DRAFT_162820 [Serpula lacrymans var. lacrymans S7.3]